MDIDGEEGKGTLDLDRDAMQRRRDQAAAEVAKRIMERSAANLGKQSMGDAVERSSLERKAPHIGRFLPAKGLPIVIERGQAGGFVISQRTDAQYIQVPYAACSTAHETANLILNMLVEMEKP